MTTEERINECLETSANHAEGIRQAQTVLAVEALVLGFKAGEITYEEFMDELHGVEETF